MTREQALELLKSQDAIKNKPSDLQAAIGRAAAIVPPPAPIHKPVAVVEPPPAPPAPEAPTEEPKPWWQLW